MATMRAALASARFACAMLFVLLLLAVHSLAPAGFMPAFEHGAVTIIVCPDAADSVAPMRMDAAGHHKVSHEPCPYAAVSSPGALGTDWTSFLPVPFLAVALLIGRILVAAERQPNRERPPVRGPPDPA